MKRKIKHSLLLLPLLLAIPTFAGSVAAAGISGFEINSATHTLASSIPADPHCGDGKDGSNIVATSIDIGCQGKGNPIMDLTFAIIKLLSDGVGLVIVASLIYAGIQYTGSRGDPNATAMAIKRIRSNITALLLFIFAYAILNYIVPGQVLQ